MLPPISSLSNVTNAAGRANINGDTSVLRPSTPRLAGDGVPIRGRFSDRPGAPLYSRAHLTPSPGPYAPSTIAMGNNNLAAPLSGRCNSIPKFVNSYESNTCSYADYTGLSVHFAANSVDPVTAWLP